MTDPVTKNEIEDVLSSIRRLVSDGDTSAGRNSATDAAPRARFVLTPDLRVADDSAAFVATGAHRVEPGAAAPDAGAVSRAAPETPLMPPQAQLPRDRTRLEATIAELEAAVTRQREDWEPDGDEEERGESPVMAWPGRATHGETTDAEDAELLPAQDDDNGPAAEPARDLMPATEDPTDDWAAPDLPPQLDEALLRELVAEALRDALRGPLGRQITHNVRKLVRQEIARALAIQKRE